MTTTFIPKRTTAATIIIAKVLIKSRGNKSKRNLETKKKVKQYNCNAHFG